MREQTRKNLIFHRETENEIRLMISMKSNAKFNFAGIIEIDKSTLIKVRVDNFILIRYL